MPRAPYFIRENFFYSGTKVIRDMFVIVLTYVEPLDVVDRHLAAHVEYLKKQYEAGIFIASGRRIQRTGGVILARAENRHALQEILGLDPFCVRGVAEYDVIEFSPAWQHLSCPVWLNHEAWTM